MSIKNFIKIITVLNLFLISCSDENHNKSNYKKKTSIPITGQSIDKKVNPSKKVSDFY
ncbi:MAG: hypothetical protein CFH34_01002 [Alphaproteobacteria bacterium MarineAlpha9_Bin4]|nr:MAG: hypothetical protein CFH34_01002 [Alphaproteobacteria bacterium MarineAlpha9_Bin4]|tara:strand:+ start:1376 stop:1549 length:174 start_codon:yes stop_codon:yes gene_type:complete